MDLEVFYAVDEDDGADNTSDSNGAAPMTAHEYLRQVALDRRRYDDVSIAKHPPPSKPTAQRQGASSCATDANGDSSNASASDDRQFPPLPADCRHTVLADFGDVRARLRRQRAALARAHALPKRDWPAYCVTAEWRTYCLGDGRYPALCDMLAMPYDVYMDALSQLNDWLEGGVEPVDRLFEWLFAILAVMEKPLDPDHQACLRQTVRACKQIRSTTTDEQLRHRCTFFVCIIAHYFGQCDLAD